jgi:non-specific protein-tyrosine kinase
MNLITLTNPQSVAAEAYRSLRTNLYFASLETPLKTIVVTSPGAAENRGTVLANLAIVLAQSEKKVIAVDADLRHPVVHELFGLMADRGLADMLVDETLASHPPLCATNIPGLQVLTSGKVQSNPLDLLNSHRMSNIISMLSGLADVVLFNAPPMIGVSDTAIIASQTDGVLLVVELGKTRREQAQRAKDLLGRAHAHLLGAVMSNASLEGSLAGM